MNDGESPWNAAVREGREETSLKVQAKRLAGVYRVPKESDLVFTFICAQEEGIAHPGDAVEEVGWFPLSALPENIREHHAERARDSLADQTVMRNQK